jgi:hypothetical protein
VSKRARNSAMGCTVFTILVVYCVLHPGSDIVSESLLGLLISIAGSLLIMVLNKYEDVIRTSSSRSSLRYIHHRVPLPFPFPNLLYRCSKPVLTIPSLSASLFPSSPLLPPSLPQPLTFFPAPLPLPSTHFIPTQPTHNPPQPHQKLFPRVDVEHVEPGTSLYAQDVCFVSLLQRMLFSRVISM